MANYNTLKSIFFFALDYAKMVKRFVKIIGCRNKSNSEFKMLKKFGATLHFCFSKYSKILGSCSTLKDKDKSILIKCHVKILSFKKCIFEKDVSETKQKYGNLD